MTGILRRLLSVCLVLGAVGCAGDTPTSPLGDHKVVYRIFLTDEAEVAYRRAEYPSGVSGISPESAAERFKVPLDGQTPQPGRSFVPPGILIEWQGYAFDRSVSRGIAEDSGLRYEWVGYFYPSSDR